MGRCITDARQGQSRFAYDGPIDVACCPAGDSAFGCRQMIGNVWEWTASDFLPFEGFEADPYKDYSQPWFGTRKVLRGGCWATSARVAEPPLCAISSRPIATTYWQASAAAKLKRSCVRITRIRIEQLLAMDLVAGDVAPPFGRNQPIDELLAEFLFTVG